MPACAIFADTQAEPKAVYDNLRWLMSPGVLSFPVHIVTAGHLTEEMRRAAAVVAVKKVDELTTNITTGPNIGGRSWALACGFYAATYSAYKPRTRKILALIRAVLGRPGLGFRTADIAAAATPLGAVIYSLGKRVRPVLVQEPEGDARRTALGIKAPPGRGMGEYPVIDRD